uniref:Uncharacterized protein n=1 Tax=Arundo donax TaxID=35708 RepID=A0A0A9D2F4_ARUDO
MQVMQLSLSMVKKLSRRERRQELGTAGIQSYPIVVSYVQKDLMLINKVHISLQSQTRKTAVQNREILRVEETISLATEI